MKTLDEVIKAIEYCINNNGCMECPYSNNDANGCYGDDALHYLKEYRERYIQVEVDDETAKEFAEMVYRAMDNPPLTWEELKQMFHRPVWIETKTKKMWAIINDFDGLTPNNENVNVIHTSHKGAKCSHFQKKLMGQTWQAYRKERK